MPVNLASIRQHPSKRRKTEFGASEVTNDPYFVEDEVVNNIEDETIDLYTDDED